MGNESEFRRENPPFAVECQIPTLHIGERYLLPAADFARVFSKSPPQRPLAFGSSFRSLADVNEFSTLIKGVDAAGLRPNAPAQMKKGAVFKLFNHLCADSTVEIEIKMMLIVCHRSGDTITFRCFSQQFLSALATDFATVSARRT